MRNRKLFTLAEILAVKHASVNPESIRQEIESNIKTAIINASTNSVHGIMNFQDMIDEDGVDLSITVSRDNTMGFNTAKVLEVQVSDPSLTAKYQPLKEQVQSYLTKHLDLFAKYSNEDLVDYDHFALTVKYEPKENYDNLQPVATR